jgi:hypothetical protein
MREMRKRLEPQASQFFSISAPENRKERIACGGRPKFFSSSIVAPIDYELVTFDPGESYLNEQMSHNLKRRSKLEFV